MSRAKVVDQGIPYGVYIWRVNGRPVMDQNKNYLIAPARRGDLRAIAALARAVKGFGIEGGEAHFQEGARPISQTEWEDQMARQAAGEVPDPYDLGNLIDEYKYQKELDSQ